MTKRLLVVPSLFLVNLTACVTVRLHPGAESARYTQIENKFLDSVNMTVKDQQFTGLAAAFWGADVGARLRADKIERVRSTIDLYLADRGMISVSAQ